MDTPSPPDRIAYKELPDYLSHPDVNNTIERLASTRGNGSHRYAVFTFPVPAFDPLAGLELVGRRGEFQFYWERPDQEIAFSAGEQEAEIRASGSGRFRVLSVKVADLERHTTKCSLVRHSLSGPHLVGGFSFFDTIEDENWNAFGSASLTLPGWVLIRDGKMGLLSLTIRSMPGDGKRSIRDKLGSKLARFEELFQFDDTLDTGRAPLPDGNRTYLDRLDAADDTWIKTVDKAKKLIGAKTLEKIVLAREVRCKIDSGISETHILNTLRNQYPTCYNFLIRKEGGRAFLGCSPERLVSFHNTYLLTESLAGSTPRGTTATEDLYLEKRLLSSEKNRREHHYVMKAIENRLRPFTRRLERADIPGIKKLKNVQHLFTPVTAWLNEEVDRFSVLEQLHPTPAVGGFPRDKAIRHIRELEPFDRGWYAGPVGWLNMNGGGEFAVAIRSGLVEDGDARLFAGCGIVEDSDPLIEWEETKLKLMPMLSAFRHDGFRQPE